MGVRPLDVECQPTLWVEQFAAVGQAERDRLEVLGGPLLIARSSARYAIGSTSPISSWGNPLEALDT